MGSLERLLPYLHRFRVPFWTGIASLIVARLFEATIPLFLRQGIDRVAAGDGALALPAGGILACVAARFVCIRWGRRRVREIGLEVAVDLRRRLYAHLQRQGPAFFGAHATGDLMARAINDLQLVRQLVGQGTRTVLVLVCSGAVAFAFMVSLSPGLTLLLLPPLPLVGIAAWWLARRLYASSLAVQAGFSTLSERVQENLGGIRTIQAQAQEAREIERFSEVNDRYAIRYRELVRTHSLLSSLMPALGALCTLVILGAGGSRVVAGELSVGTFSAFLWYLGMVLLPVREMGTMVNLFQRGAAATARIFEILDAVPEIRDRPAPEAPEQLAGAIELRDARYRYPGAAREALRDVSLSVAAGETLALVGRVGAGKSTLLRLLVRSLDPPPGSVLLDGVDVRALSLSLVREQVALVGQEAVLFATSLRENLSYDDPLRSDKEIWSAAEVAGLRETVEGLPEGLETAIGERGITLSGGQKQRSTLARGAIRQAPVLLLDDCFSSVDAQTEEQILRRLRELRRGRTTLLVSHRVSTARWADRIAVLDQGRLVELGTHEELVARRGPYAALERAQRRRERLATGLAQPPGAALP